MPIDIIVRPGAMPLVVGDQASLDGFSGIALSAEKARAAIVLQSRDGRQVLHPIRPPFADYFYNAAAALVIALGADDNIAWAFRQPLAADCPMPADTVSRAEIEAALAELDGGHRLAITA